MKIRHTFPTGQTSASKIKALLSSLEARHGAPAVDAWLSRVRLGRGDFDDETRLLPLAALRDAIEAYVEATSDTTLEQAAPYLVAGDNLGVWARVLRGTRAPEEAFARIDSSDSEHGRTTRWETIESGPGFWRGRVRIGHDPKVEADGLLARMRGIELTVVPELFGFPRGTVTTGEVTDETQEFVVTWPVPNATRAVTTFGVAGAVLGGAVLASHPSLLTALVALVSPIALGAVGLARVRSAVSRIDSRSQAVRVSALERNLALREGGDRVAAGDLEGTVVAGQFRIGTRMGSGASGVIYEATRITDGMPVAIKLLRAASAHDAVASDRLRREAEALGLSWHPNVVEVIDHGHLPDGTSYLVMELLSGETLANRLKTQGRIAPDALVPIALQVADALVAVHAAGIVHRDLKPSNIYLTPASAADDEHDAAYVGGERVKVFDFGIARVEWEEMRITNMGAPLGTPGYMSPEQETGGEIDARSDLFAFGAVLYECLVGEPPPPSPSDLWKPGIRPPSSFALRLASGPSSGKESLSALEDARHRPASGVHAASHRMRSATPPPFDVALVPSAWRAVVERALAKRPDDRFQEARAMLTALRAIAKPEAPGEAKNGA